MRRRNGREVTAGAAEHELASPVKVPCAQAKQRGCCGSFREELQWRREQKRGELEEEDDL
jgi:hypothetical protein